MAKKMTKKKTKKLLQQKNNRKGMHLLKCDLCEEFFYLAKSSVRHLAYKDAEMGVLNVEYFKCPHCGNVYMTKAESPESHGWAVTRQKVAREKAKLAARLNQNKLTSEAYNDLVAHQDAIDAEAKKAYFEISEKVKKVVREHVTIQGF